LSTRKSRALVVVAAAAVLVAGCTSGSAGPPATHSATSASTSASPTASSGPTLPAAARAQDAAGAQEFVKYWFDVVNYTFTSRDTTLFRSLALPECRFCADFASRVDRRKAEGSTYEGGRFTPRIVVAPGPDGDGTVTVDIRTDVAAARVISKSGAMVESTAAATDYAVAVRLRPTSGGWKVSGVAQ
jgi:hypothetical protein